MRYNSRTKTALKKLIQTGKVAAPNDDVAQEHFMILETLLKQMVIHYELSNFERKIIFKNNSAYWLGKNTSESVLQRIVMMVFLEVGILLIILYLKAIDADEFQMKLKFI
jgi:oxygen-independent coproporphyrinogen-3 oxidase